MDREGKGKAWDLDKFSEPVEEWNEGLGVTCFQNGYCGGDGGVWKLKQGKQSNQEEVTGISVQK